MLIGLGHQKQVGKDTVANILHDKYDFSVTSFAAPLKDLVLLMERFHKGMLREVEYQMQLSAWACRYGMDRYSEVYRILYRWQVPVELFEQEENGKLRKMLQWVGTDLVRKQYDENFWIKAFATRIKDIHPRNIWTVVTDVRFLNEKKFIETYGTAVKVTRPNQEVNGDIHESETALLKEKWQYTIVNDRTLEELEAQCEELMQALLLDLSLETRPTLKDISEVSLLLRG